MQTTLKLVKESNSRKSFQNSQTIETGLSDFHRLVVAALQMYLPNDQLKIISYRDYKNIDNKRFLEGFQLVLDKLGSLAENVEILMFLINMKNKNMLGLTKLTLWILN